MSQNYIRLKKIIYINNWNALYKIYKIFFDKYFYKTKNKLKFFMIFY